MTIYRTNSRALEHIQALSAFEAHFPRTPLSQQGQKFRQLVDSLPKPRETVPLHVLHATAHQSKGVLAGCGKLLLPDPRQSQGILALDQVSFMRWVRSTPHADTLKGSKEPSAVLENSFLAGLRQYFKKAEPKYCRSLAATWALFVSGLDSPLSRNDLRKQSRAVGHQCATYLEEQRQLGEAAGLRPSFFNTTTSYRRDVEAFLYAKGWMIGRTEAYLQQDPQRAAYNVYTDYAPAAILSEAWTKNDLDIVRRRVALHLEDDTPQKEDVTNGPLEDIGPKTAIVRTDRDTGEVQLHLSVNRSQPTVYYVRHSTPAPLPIS